jgi:hypothetical protein
MHEWDTFAVVLGGSAGALVGLLFVAMSIHAGRISGSADLRNRAAQTLVVFATLLLVAVLLSIPLQPDWLLGVEPLVLAVIVAILLIILVGVRDRVSHAVRSPSHSKPSIRRPSPQSVSRSREC